MRLAFVALLLAGCATTPSFQDALGASYLATKTVADTIHAACRNADPGGPCEADAPISTADKDRARALLTDALDLIDTAAALYAAGDDSGAQTQLARARALLALAEGVIRERD